MSRKRKGVERAAGEAANSPAGTPESLSSILAFLADKRVDWPALSAELRAMASGMAAHSASSDSAPADPAEAQLRDTFNLLAEYLAHADRTRGLPAEVQRLLESDATARAAQRAFNEAMRHRREWAQLAQEFARTPPLPRIGP